MANEPGGRRRLLVDNPEIEYVAPSAWSPDGKSVLVLLERPDQTWQIAWISVDTGVVTPLKSLGWRVQGFIDRPRALARRKANRVCGAREQPTGCADAAGHRRPVCLCPCRRRLARDGAREEHQPQRRPDWTPDGGHVLFLSNRSGTFDLWSASTADGKTSVSPLERNIGRISWLGVTAAGSYYYALQRQNIEQVLVSGLKEKGVPAQSFIGLHAVWSPDGKRLLFVRRSLQGATSYDLVLHALDTGEERNFSHGEILAVGAPRWFHDGKSFLKLTGLLGEQRTLQRIDAGSGAFTELPVADWTPLRLILQNTELSPDDRTLYVAASAPESDPRNARPRPDRVVAFDLATRQQRRVVMVSNGFSAFC